MDDMLVKILRTDLHFGDLKEIFDTLRKYKMRLDLKQSVFGVLAVKFLGFMVSQREIEANPKNVEVIMRMESPRNTKKVQRLAGRITTLNQIISKSKDKCLPFFCLLRKAFEWTRECEMAF